MSNNVLDVEGLKKIFIDSAEEKVLVSENNTVEKVEEILPTKVETVAIEDVKNDEDFFEKELKEILNMSKEMIGSAKYLIDNCPDAETVMAAANMIHSISSLLTEFNKSNVIRKKYHQQRDIEEMKIKAREKLIRLKAELNPNLGSNNTFNLQQNNLMTFQTDKIIHKLLQAQKQLN